MRRDECADGTPAERRSARRTIGPGVILGVLAAVALLATPAAALAAGAFTGTVTTDATGGPIPNCNVTLYRDVAGAVYSNPTYDANTNASGVYVRSGVTPGSYRVRFLHGPGDWAYEYAHDAYTLADATPVTVGDMATATVNAALTRSGVVTGTITSEATGGPLPGKRARAYRFEPATGWWTTVGDASAQADGAYLLKLGAPTGRYRFVFWDSDATYTAEFYEDAGDWYDLGRDVTVTAGTTLTGINAALSTLAPDAFEPDDDPAHAVAVAVGPLMRRTIHLDAAGTPDRDFVRFSATVGKTYVLDALATRLDTYMRLLDTDGTTPLAASDDTDQDGNSRIVWTAPVSGVYYAMTRGWALSSRGRYELRIAETVVPAAPVAATYRVSNNLPRRGRAVRFYGSFAPAAASARRLVYFQRLSGKKWTNAVICRLNSKGRYSIFWSERTRGIRRFRVHLAAQVGWAPATTRTKWVRWR